MLQSRVNAALLDDSDRELIRALFEKDSRALAAIYERYARPAYALFLRITRNQSSAEDLVQDLFLRIWANARKFDPEKGILHVWVMAVARNLAIDHVRSAAAQYAMHVRPVDDLDRSYFSGNHRADESVIERIQLIRAALAKLSPKQQRALRLAYFEGCSHSEIAIHLHEPLGTVKSSIRSALRDLRTALEGIGQSAATSGEQFVRISNELAKLSASSTAIEYSARFEDRCPAHHVPQKSILVRLVKAKART